jgi:hypothetical protein
MSELKGSSSKLVLKESTAMYVKLNMVFTEALSEIYEYNNKIRDTGYYLKPVHMSTRRLADGTVVKYYYYGRYWYRVEKGESGSVRWIYLGREKPSPQLPDPPRNPLEGVVVKKYNGKIEIEFLSEEVLREVYERLAKYEKKPGSP